MKLSATSLSFFNGDTWAITNNNMSWQLFDVVPMGNSELAVYEVTGLSIEAVDILGTGHTITVAPDGLPSPNFGTGIPGFDPDSGLVNVYSDGFLDMIVYDLSIDGQPVNQADILGGPAFVAAWLGFFPSRRPSPFLRWPIFPLRTCLVTCPWLESSSSSRYRRAF